MLCYCEVCTISGLSKRECNGKLIFLFLNLKICCGYSKEPSELDGSFEHPKQMFELLDKKIFTILHIMTYVCTVSLDKNTYIFS